MSQNEPKRAKREVQGEGTGECPPTAQARDNTRGQTRGQTRKNATTMVCERVEGVLKRFEQVCVGIGHGARYES